MKFLKLDKKQMLKSVVYRVYAFIITFCTTFLLTGDLKLSITLGILENIFKIMTYYWFDILWDKLTKKKYRPSLLFFTGLSGSGKTTIAKALVEKLKSEGHAVMLLDGDEIRDIFKNTGFDRDARLRHINDVTKMAVYLQNQGIIPVMSLIAPFEEARENSKKLTDDFTEIYIDTPLEECERRDVKGLYKKARAGEIKDFTGVHDTAPYEVPKKPTLKISTIGVPIEDCVNKILNHISQ
jgi:bifunctional enzyme CysN/CysC